EFLHGVRIDLIVDGLRPMVVIDDRLGSSADTERGRERQHENEQRDTSQHGAPPIRPFGARPFPARSPPLSVLTGRLSSRYCPSRPVRPSRAPYTSAPCPRRSSCPSPPSRRAGPASRPYPARDGR